MYRDTPGLSKRDAKILKSVQRRAHYLDKGFSICGLRFGWTFIIGIIPMAGDITDAEIDAARKTLTTNWRAMLDDPLTLERYWLGQAAAGTLVTPEERIAQVAAVTRGDIVAAAQATALDTVYFMKGAAQ